MIYAFLLLWIGVAVLAMRERKILGMIIYLGIFSTISSVCFLLFGAPDVAMAEAAVSTFSTVFLIICFEKYFSLATTHEGAVLEQGNRFVEIFKKRWVALLFTILLFGLFVYFIPDTPEKIYVKDMYIAKFKSDVGGENAVTSIYLGYRMYDTLFEALMLLVSVVAVYHMSWFAEDSHGDEKLRGVETTDKIAIQTIRLVCPGILLFGIYLILNGHISPGGGFQGGVAIATFFICRYLIHTMDDVRFKTIMIIEKLIFAGIIIVAGCFILLGIHIYFPQMKQLYLILMNTLIGMKVACGFMVIFYRYIAFERR